VLDIHPFENPRPVGQLRRRKPWSVSVLGFVPCPIGGVPGDRGEDLRLRASPQSEPRAAEPATAPAATPRRTASRHPGTRSQKPTDPVTAFIRLAAAICELIALEANLAAGPALPHGLASAAVRADPRRALLREAFRELTENSPDRATLRRETAARCDLELAADPDKTRSLWEIFYPICEAFGIAINMARLSDEIIGLDPNKTYPKLPDDHPFYTPQPNPQATSPP
jgi:hypothetical protein